MTMMTTATKGTIMVTRTVPAVIITISRRPGSMAPSLGAALNAGFVAAEVVFGLAAHLF